jgi:predicted lipid carrier protein YhbT
MMTARLPGFPQPLARVLAALPSRPPSLFFAAACNRLAWRGLQDLDWSAVDGRRVCVHARDTGLRLYLTVTPQGLRASRAARADVTFSADALDFLRLSLRLEDPDTLFFNRRLLIEGDTDLGLTLKNLLDTLELETLLASLPAGLALLACRLQARLATG